MMRLSSKDLLIIALLGIGTYLKSPITVISAVVLWAVVVAEAVLTHKNRDAEIMGLLNRMEKLEKKNDLLSTDINNVAERAKVILGENF